MSFEEITKNDNNEENASDNLNVVEKSANTTNKAENIKENNKFKNNNFNKGDKKNNFNRNKSFQKEKIFTEKIVKINRITKVTKGGRRFRFAAVVVIGDKKGRVGLGTGKANEVPDAIKKASKDAKKTLIRVPFNGTTVPHDVIGHFGAGKVMIKPAKKGTGVIAGGPSRAVMELAGINDVYTKSLGSNTSINMIRATIDGLSKMLTKSQIELLRSDVKVTNQIKKQPEQSSI